MRIIIAGTRTLNDPEFVEDAVRKSGFVVTEVVSGCARGIDTLGSEWAAQRKIPVKLFPANDDFALSSTLGGFARNGDMAAYGEALILIWDGMSGGSRNMLQHAQAQAKRRAFPIYIYQPLYD